MSDWRHQVDPQFFAKEAGLLRVQTEGRAAYDSDQATIQRIAADRTVRRALVPAFVLAAFAATGFGALQEAGDWPTVVALALLTVLWCWRAPWWLPPLAAARRRRIWQPGALAAALVVVPAALRGLPDPLQALLAAAIAAMAAAVFVSPSQAADANPALPRLRLAAAFALFAAGLVELAWASFTDDGFAPAGLAAGGAALAIVLLARPWRAAPPPMAGLAARLCVLLLVAALFAGGETPVTWYFGLAVMTAVGVVLMWDRAASRLALAPPWSLYAALTAAHLWSMAAMPAAVTAWLPAELACVTVEYLLVCLVAVRCAKAAADSRPMGYRRTNPQAVVPLLDRSGHEALGSWIA
jgi:hypothetical protein